MSGEANRSYGFGDELDNAGIEDWTRKKGANTETPAPSADEVRRVSEEAGFTRDAQPAAAPQKEPEGQVLIRAPQSQIDRFKHLGKSQEPKWPYSYVLQRALDALERELNG